MVDNDTQGKLDHDLVQANRDGVVARVQHGTKGLGAALNELEGRRALGVGKCGNGLVEEVVEVSQGVEEKHLLALHLGLELVGGQVGHAARKALEHLDTVVGGDAEVIGPGGDGKKDVRPVRGVQLCAINDDDLRVQHDVLEH